MSDGSDRRLQDILRHPDKHRHDFSALIACCTADGAVDTGLMEAHARLTGLGKNGGRQCDVTSGPCSCGAWHTTTDPR